MAEDEVDLEDGQFKRARLDTSVFPHYELKSTVDEDDNDELVDRTTPISKQKRNSESINLFGTNFDDEDDIGDFPFPSQKQNSKEEKDKQFMFEPNPLYLYNYWHRYQSLTLNWPNCDGKCGNKLGRLIHNALYGTANEECKAAAQTAQLQLGALYIDNYQISAEDLSALRSFAALNPISIQTDQVIQMWSFIDSLKGRVEQHMTEQTHIAHDHKVMKIIAKDIADTLKVKEIISTHFLCYSTPVRRYLISLLHSFEFDTNDPNENEFHSLFKLLSHKENIICDDQQTLAIWSRLTQFRDREKYFILYQLSKYACSRNTDTLFQELKRNGFHTITPNLYTADMVRILSETKQYSLMRKYNLELTAEEIISILIYTGADQISKSVRESLISEQRSCKWLHLTHALVSAIEKMHKVLVQTKSKSEMPTQLYYAIGGNIQTKQIQYFDVISTTSSKKLAVQFMKKGGTMIVFDDANRMLQGNKFIAAPLNWITKNNNNFEEWLVVCIKIYNIHKQKSNDNKGYTITVTDYETINFRSMNTWKKVIDASMILDQPNQALQQASNAVCNNSENWKCIHCQCIAPFYMFVGNVLMDNMECPFCRRYNLFAFNVPTRIVQCFSVECEKESLLREYVIDTVSKQRGAKCPKCHTLQCCAFEKSKTFEKMKAYLSMDAGYKQKLRQDKLRKELREQQRLSNIYSLNRNDASHGSVNGIQAITNKKQKSKDEKGSPKKAGGFFKWGKKKKVVRSSNLNDVEENPEIIEDDFDY